MTPNVEPILLCMDMDRTALPNGQQEESPQARPLLRRVATRPEVVIAYVSGRRKDLQIDAIREFDLPEPRYGVADVGTSIYEVQGSDWTALAEWHEQIGRSWNGRKADAVLDVVGEVSGLRLQDPEAQGPFKVSYFASASLDSRQVIPNIRSRLEAEGFQCSFIWSVDETSDTGLLDILPEQATKLHAVKFLMDKTGVRRERMVYAGDSGNDLPVLTSGLQAVLVANAIPDVREQAAAEIRKQDCVDRLYLARGEFLGMNGNYAAGILEGLAHFVPETRAWME